MFPDPPKFKEGDLVYVHNQPEGHIYKIAHVMPATEEGKSHRYYYRELGHSPGQKPIVYTGVNGYYEPVFTLCTEADIGG